MKRLDRDRYTIRALDRAIDIVMLLADGERRTLTEISDAVHLSSSTTYRLLASLMYRRFVERQEERSTYKLGLACLELAWAFRAGDPIRRLALPHLQSLRDATAETVHLAVLDVTDVVYLEKLPGLHSVGIMSSQVGARLPAYCTGLGKALLAFTQSATVRSYLGRGPFPRLTGTTMTDAEELLRELDRVRERGYAFDLGEREPEVRCVAAPLFGRQGELLAAISVAGPANRMDPLEANVRLIDQVVSAARSISATLGYRQERWPARQDG